MTTIGGLNANVASIGSQVVKNNNARFAGTAANQVVGDQVSLRFGNAATEVAGKTGFIGKIFDLIKSVTIGLPLKILKAIGSKIPVLNKLGIFKAAEQAAV